MVAGKMMERGLDKGWRAWKDEDPPALEKVKSWSQALAWAALSAAAVAGAELVARRGADLGLRHLSGKHARPAL